jgi:hypothetical protein
MIPPDSASSQTVLALYLVLGESTDARPRAAAIRHHKGDDNLAAARRVRHPHLHGVKVAAHERRVLVAQRDVDGSPGSTHFLRRGDEGRPFLNRRTEWFAELWMEDRRGVLELSFLADDRRFAEAFDRRRRDPQRRHCHLPEQGTEFVTDIGQC